MNRAGIKKRFIKFDDRKPNPLRNPAINIFFLLCFSIPARAQQARQYAFAHLSLAQGLAANFVHNVVQDSKGYIWMGTVNGLQRYDGIRFMTFRHNRNDGSSVPSNNMSCYMDRRDHLWLITEDNKVGIFNTSRFTYREVPIRWRDTLKMFRIKQFFEDSRGRLFLNVLFHNLYIYREKEQDFVPADDSIPRPQNWKLIAIAEEPAGHRIWLACDSGLAVYNVSTHQTSYRGHNAAHDPVIDRLGNELFTGGLHIARNGQWLCFVSWPPGSGCPFVYRYTFKTGEVQKFNLSIELRMGYHEIGNLLEQRNGKLWYCGKPFVAEYVEETKHFAGVRNEYKDEQSIRFDGASSMFEDRDRNVWIATDNGVFIFNPEAQLFNSYNLVHPDGTGVVDGAAQSLLQLKNGQVWVGCWGSGLYFYDRNLNPLPPPPGIPKNHDEYNGSVWDILEDSITGKVWLACQEGALAVYDFALKKTTIMRLGIFGRSTIRQIAQDHQGNIWFGTQNGLLIKWDRKASSGDVHKGYQQILKGGRVHKLMVDSDGSLWSATLYDGLYKIDPATSTVIRHYMHTDPEGYRLWNESPYDLLRYDDSTMLIANSALAILNTSTGRISFFTEEDGLPNNNVFCLQKDGRNVVWMGMRNGLVRLNFEKRKMAIFDRRDGISCDLFNPAEAFSISGNRLVFTTDHNFLVFEPEHLLDTMAPPDVQITDFRSGNKSLWLDSLIRHGKIRLPYDNTAITIAFSDMVFLGGYKVTYMLEGLDKEWIRSDLSSRQAIYNYLAPGNYLFKVKSEDADGRTCRNITTLAIAVSPPFWRTWWFYGFIILLAISVFYWIDRERVKRLLALQSVRTQIAGNLHEDINTTLNDISLLSEMARIKADKDIERSKEYIGQISTKSRNMVIAMDDILWSLHPENDNMEKTIARMTEFSDALTNRKGINIEMAVDEKVKSLQLDMKSRHEFFLIFKDALRSMSEYSNGTQILVNIDMQRAGLSMKIRDNGRYEDPTAIFSDSCMLSMLRRAEQIHALLDIQTDKKGVSVILLMRPEA